MPTSFRPSRDDIRIIRKCAEMVRSFMIDRIRQTFPEFREPGMTGRKIASAPPKPGIRGGFIYTDMPSFNEARWRLRAENRVFELHCDASGSIWWEDIALLPVFPKECIVHECLGVTPSSSAGYMVEFPTTETFTDFILSKKEPGAYWKSL